MLGGRVAVPARVPELPADLECDDGLAGTSRHGQQNTLLTTSDCRDSSIDGDFLVVARNLANEVVARREKSLSGVSHAFETAVETGPELVWLWKLGNFTLHACQEVELDYAGAV